MSDRNPRDSEHEAEAARKKLAETEQRADESLERAAKELRELTAEQEHRAARLRKESTESTDSETQADEEGG